MDSALDIVDACKFNVFATTDSLDKGAKRTTSVKAYINLMSSCSQS